MGRLANRRDPLHFPARMATITSQQALELAIEHHRAGRAAEAEALYRRLLAVDPHNSDALHLLGVIVHQGGGSAEAVDLLQAAISINPTIAFFHNSLGNVLQEQGRLE